MAAGATRAAGLTLLFVTLAGASANAQAPLRLRPVVLGEPTEAAEGWRRRAHETAPTPLPAPEAFAEARLRGMAAALRQVDAAAEARREGRDDVALGLLAAAREALEAHADVPGMVAHLVEVHLATAQIAHTAGAMGLFRESVRRATLLDPQRALRAGEVAPDVREAAASVRAETRDGATGRFEVVVDGTPGAAVYLDDHLVGTSPVMVEATAGPHFVRLVASGRVARGFGVDVLPGQRAPVVTRLSLDARARARARVSEAARGGDIDGVVGALRETSAEVWLVAASNDGERALVRHCDGVGCGPAARWRGEDTPRPLRASSAAAPTEDARHDAAWLLGPQPRSPEDEASPRRRRRWPLWVALGVAAAGGIVAAVAATRPSDPPSLRTTIDFGDLSP